MIITYTDVKKQIKINIEKLIGEKRIEEAEVLICEYIKLDNNDSEVLCMNAVVELLKGNKEKSIELLMQAYLLDGKNFDVVYNIAFMYYEFGENELAFEYTKRAIKICNNDEMKKELIDQLSILQKKVSTEINTKVINIEVLYDNDINERKRIIDKLKQLDDIGEFNKIIEIYYSYVRLSELSVGEIYYYVARAYNGLKNFELAYKYHNIAIKVEAYLSNICEFDNKFKYRYEEDGVACIGCGEKKYDIINVSNQSIGESNKGIINPIRVWVRCNSCGLVYANPMPKEVVLNKYYSIIAKEKFGGIYGDIKQREKFLFEMSKQRLDRIRAYTDKVNLLDIGTGVGLFVKKAIDEGFDANGLELTPEDCKYAKDNYGLNLMQRNFYSFSDAEKYDIVTMFEVIEHLSNPLGDLMKIYDIVNTGGIFVLATPILDSEYAKEYKEKNAFWNVVTHLSYFDMTTMVNYLRKAGFKVLEVRESMEGMGRMEFYCEK